MIDEDFIIAYTNGLYSVAEESRPTYDEFRDMFSSGQLKSKNWAISALKRHLKPNDRIVIVGSWFGTLGMMINRIAPEAKITLLDIDPRCKEFVDYIARWQSNIMSVTDDMYDYTYTEDVVINTSCEHVADLQSWIETIPSGTLVLLQSNNNKEMEGHINCCNSVEEFVSKVELNEILYKGEFIMPMYTRYMILGRV